MDWVLEELEVEDMEVIKGLQLLAVKRNWHDPESACLLKFCTCLTLISSVLKYLNGVKIRRHWLE